MSKTYTELFVIDYAGTVSDLTDHITRQTGVRTATTSERAHRDVDSEVDYDITYDTHETDRTQLANDIESLSGVSSVTFG